MLKSIQIILRGIGQVFFQNNPLSGLLFLAGIFYNSWLLGIGALLGNIIGSLFAKLLKYSAEDIENGLYGFNGTLVGIAIFFYFGAGWPSVMALAGAALLSTFIMQVMKSRMPAFTAPFIIATWVTMAIITGLHIAHLPTPPVPQNAPLNIFSAISKGFGQVMFQDNIITGLLFFTGIIINDRQQAAYAAYGAVFGTLFALMLPVPVSALQAGLFGYNAVLASIALSGKKYPSFTPATLGIFLSVFITIIAGKTGMPMLTAPFVLAAWIGLVVKKKMQHGVK